MGGKWKIKYLAIPINFTVIISHFKCNFFVGLPKICNLKLSNLFKKSIMIHAP